MFFTRLKSGIILILLSLLVMVMGGNTLLVTVFIISEIGLFELYRVMKIEESVMGVTGYVTTAAWYFLLYQFGNQASLTYYFILLLSVFMILMLLCFVMKYPKFSAVQLFSSIFGFVYVPFMLSFLYLTRETVRLGEWLVWLTFVASWGSDTCAYVVGRLFGKRKLAPVLSPKKSVEGAIGGILGSAGIGAIFAYIMIYFKNEPLSIIPGFMLIGAVGSVISQIGDLAASGIKRNFEVKDYGRLIPGHGGILDRFDSIIITAPIVFFLADLFVKHL